MTMRLLPEEGVFLRNASLQNIKIQLLTAHSQKSEITE